METTNGNNGSPTGTEITSPLGERYLALRAQVGEDAGKVAVAPVVEVPPSTPPEKLSAEQQFPSQHQFYAD